MTALSPAESQRYDVLRRSVLDAVGDVKSTVIGFRLRVGESVSAGSIAEWMTLEHRCCPFLTLQLALKSDGIWIEMGGSAVIKDFLKDESKTLAMA